ncbi:bifunctional diaminohydroxyphosphoribosylaminopyrimidine deaminase/5-amino-6-(5-phosphoribosylamino)uracil reductase RibD [Candidatus Bipolaricaulota bacterium]|nr:bifunctional diaminohydroxyphosphoribosylaminopyrimidine deaminase/5-amino-6-(5-phosphoribosylamino)uracil reductase RibD [Candidatus Bipolaricaulota bacterium]
MNENTGRNYMKRALRLAKRGGGFVNPNPQVGAVIVRDGEIVGEGYHEMFGGPHAEVKALQDAGESASGATLYVNLEPCVHYGKTPPCTKKIIESGLDRVYVAIEDPNPRVAGKGIKRLREEGIKVSVGLMEEEARKVNEIFLHYVEKNRPFVLLKLAMTLDGKIATRTGDSRWISSETSRKLVHELRARYSAVGVGVSTVIADDPRLNVRNAEGPDGARFVFDSNGRTPESSRIFTISSDAPTIIATGETLPEDSLTKFEKNGAKVWQFRKKRGHLDLDGLLERMGERGYDSLLVEGGGEIAWSFIDQNLVDKIRFFYSPKIVGGKEAVPSVGGRGRATVEDALGIEDLKVEEIGGDVSVVGYPV